MEKTGLCGIPSLWMDSDELRKEKHVSKALVEEKERISGLHQVLKSHKQWENEKYFGTNNNFKKQSGATMITGSSTNSDFIYFNTDVLKSKIKSLKDDKIAIINEDTTEKDLQVLP